MMRTIVYKNISGAEVIRQEQRIADQAEYTIPHEDVVDWASDNDVRSDIVNEDAEVGNGDEFFDSVTGLDYLYDSTIQKVQPTGDFVCAWSCMKNFYDNNKNTFMNYFETPSYYYVWLEFRGQKFYVPELDKTDPRSTEQADFEDNYKSLCNTPEAIKTRISNCKIGRKLHDRYITFTTSSQDSYDNTDYKEDDYGDVTYIMKDVDGNTTTDESLCKETWIDWEPSFDYETTGGAIFIPDSLSGNDDNAWEIHVVCAPDVPEANGGCIQFIANPRIKWVKGSWLRVDASLNPAEVLCDPTYHSHKIRFIVKHPVSASTEFQINLRLYK